MFPGNVFRHDLTRQGLSHWLDKMTEEWAREKFQRGVNGVAETSWVQVHDFRDARALFLLPCNAAACVGDYFRAEVYSKRGWNTWRDADAGLRDLRERGRVGFAAVDSSTLDTAPEDPRGAIVLETEMHRAANPSGEDWGAPSWRWFRPTRSGRWKALEELTEALGKGVLRVHGMGIPNVLALVNPRAYFLALAAAVEECHLSKKWVLFRVPAHPRHLIPAVREVVPVVRAVAGGAMIEGGIYHVPSLYCCLQEEEKHYRHSLPDRWGKHNVQPAISEVRKKWKMMEEAVVQ